MRAAKTNLAIGLVVGVIIIIAIALRTRVIVHSLKISRQTVQFGQIEVGLELFARELGKLPPSGAADPVGEPYCGAMKLCEAMLGQDTHGFHKHSVFRADGRDSEGTRHLYPSPRSADNLRDRAGPFLRRRGANVHALADVFGNDHTLPFAPHTLVLCDTYERTNRAGNKTGMPILYYKSDTFNVMNDSNDDTVHGIAFDYKDNQALMELAMLAESGADTHLPITDHIISNMVSGTQPISQPKDRRDIPPYVLVSAGPDGLYATPDDEYYIPR